MCRAVGSRREAINESLILDRRDGSFHPASHPAGLGPITVRTGCSGARLASRSGWSRGDLDVVGAGFTPWRAGHDGGSVEVATGVRSGNAHEASWPGESDATN
jgi:hypothetical protein